MPPLEQSLARYRVDSRAQAVTEHFLDTCCILGDPFKTIAFLVASHP